MKFPRPGKAREAEPAPESAPTEQQRLCPQCNATISSRAKTCMNCGADLVAIAKAEAAQAKAIEREQRVEAAQRPTRIFVIIVHGHRRVCVRGHYHSDLALVVHCGLDAHHHAHPHASGAAHRHAARHGHADRHADAGAAPGIHRKKRRYARPGSLVVRCQPAELMAFNGKAEDDLIVVGEVLKIPPPTPSPAIRPRPSRARPRPSASNEIVYIVQPGDTLSDIAANTKPRWNDSTPQQHRRYFKSDARPTIDHSDRRHADTGSLSRALSPRAATQRHAHPDRAICTCEAVDAARSRNLCRRFIADFAAMVVIGRAASE